MAIEPIEPGSISPLFRPEAFPLEPRRQPVEETVEPGDSRRLGPETELSRPPRTTLDELRRDLLRRDNDPNVAGEGLRTVSSRLLRLREAEETAEQQRAPEASERPTRGELGERLAIEGREPAEPSELIRASTFEFNDETRVTPEAAQRELEPNIRFEFNSFQLGEEADVSLSLDTQFRQEPAAETTGLANPNVQSRIDLEGTARPIPEDEFPHRPDVVEFGEPGVLEETFNIHHDEYYRDPADPFPLDRLAPGTIDPRDVLRRTRDEDLDVRVRSAIDSEGRDTAQVNREGDLDIRVRIHRDSDTPEQATQTLSDERPQPGTRIGTTANPEELGSESLSFGVTEQPRAALNPDSPFGERRVGQEGTEALLINPLNDIEARPDRVGTVPRSTPDDATDLFTVDEQVPVDESQFDPFGSDFLGQPEQLGGRDYYDNENLFSTSLRTLTREHDLDIAPEVRETKEIERIEGDDRRIERGIFTYNEAAGIEQHLVGFATSGSGANLFVLV